MMATAAELLSGGSSDILIIDLASRTINVPESKKVLGVESDDEVQKLRFRMPRYYNGIDLSVYDIRINYENPESEGDVSAGTDVKVGADTIEFSWLVQRHAFIKAGTVDFVVCLRKLNGTEVVSEFNTTVTSLEVLPGLETEEAAVEGYPDAVATVAAEVLQQAKENGDFTPVKGEDYFTADERAEMVAEVIADRDALYSHAVVGEASGTVVRVNDVSPLEHTVKARVYGKNRFNALKIGLTGPHADYAYVSHVDVGAVTVYSNETDNGYCATGKKLRNVCTKLEVGKTYILTATTPSAERKYMYLTGAEVRWDFGTSKVMTEAMLDSTIVLYGLMDGEGNGPCTISNIQLEEGSVATEYEACVDPESVGVYATGKNLFDPEIVPNVTARGITVEYEGDGVFYLHGTYDASNQDVPLGLCYVNIPCIAEDYYTVSIKKLSGTNTMHFYAYFGVGVEKNVRTNWDTARIEAGAADGTVATATSRPSKSVDGVRYISSFWFYLPAKTEAYSLNCRVKVWLEKGSVGTEWTPYTGGTYACTADGYANAVSVSPTMEVISDPPGLGMDIEYCRDINAALQVKEPSDTILLNDVVTGTPYKLYISDGKLTMEVNE